MINTIVTLLLITLLFVLGHITQAFKKLFGLITKLILKILSFFGIKIGNKEQGIKVNAEFKSIYKDINKVKLSKKNIKDKSSIDWVNFTILIIAGILVIANLAVVSGNAISNWIFGLLKWTKLIKTETDMNVMYTAVLFSTLSFSATKIMGRWKETKQNRIERKKLKIKLEALQYMDSKELLDNAIKKDEINKKELE